MSYPGNTAWALSNGLPEQVNGLGLVLTLSSFRDELLSFGGYTQQGTLDWTISWWQDWVTHDDPEDPWWHTIDHSASAGDLTAPTTMIAGWQDVFLPFQMKDFVARQNAFAPRSSGCNDSGRAQHPH